MAGCGYAAPSEESKARATAQTLVMSCAADRPERAGQVLTEPLRATFQDIGPTARACAAFLGVASAGRTDAQLWSRFRRIAVTRLRLRGGTARATLARPGARPSTLGLSRDAGEWLIDTSPSGA